MGKVKQVAEALREEIGETKTMVCRVDKLDWRKSGSGDNSRILSGYAAVYNSETVLFDDVRWCFKERIITGAFDKVLARQPDVHLNVGHDMTRAIARTGVRGMGGLELSSDSYGLHIYARLNPDDPDVQALAAKMDYGIMDQMSFAFQLKQTGYKTETTVDATGKEIITQTILEVSNLYDVCVCAQGAYPQTEAVLRSFLIDRAMERTDVVPLQGDTSAAVANLLVEGQLIALKARAALARNKFRGG